MMEIKKNILKLISLDSFLNNDQSIYDLIEKKTNNK